MNKPFIIRFGYLESCTLGWLYAGDLRLSTIEDAWRPDPDGPGGQRRDGSLLESCIPDGLYTLEPHNTEKHPNVWCMVNKALGIYHWPADIPAGQKYGRFACLIHAGNTDDSVEGCIAVGMSHSIVNGRHFVNDSQIALSKLRDVIGTGKNEMQIRPVAGTAEKL